VIVVTLVHLEKLRLLRLMVTGDAFIRLYGERRESQDPLDLQQNLERDSST
jgi:hypothetical protein